MTVFERFIQDVKTHTHIYFDIRDEIGFAFCFEGRIADVYEKEHKFYFNQEYLDMQFGFFSLKMPWEQVIYENYLYILDTRRFRVCVQFSSQ